MNINDEFDCASVYLEMAEEKWQRGQYSASLIALTKAYPFMRSLIEKLYQLDRAASSAVRPAGDNHP